MRGFVLFQRIASSRARSDGLDMCVCVANVCVRRGSVRALSPHGGDRRYLRLDPQRAGHRPMSRALAAGVTWTCQTSNAKWVSRVQHTSVIDAAGAIYVIGGGGVLVNGISGTFHDVWASTDGGA